MSAELILQVCLGVMLAYLYYVLGTGAYKITEGFLNATGQTMPTKLKVAIVILWPVYLMFTAHS